jgi:hypothetical protein
MASLIFERGDARRKLKASASAASPLPLPLKKRDDGNSKRKRKSPNCVNRPTGVSASACGDSSLTDSLGARALKKQKPNVKTNKGQAQKGQGGQGQERGQGHEEEEEEKDDKEDKKDKDKDEENLFDRDIDPQDPLGHLGVFRTQLAATTSHAKRTELRSLQTRLARTVGKRWMQLEAHALQQTMRALKREILRIDQGAHVVAFDARAAPYVEKYKRALRAAATRTRVPITHTRDTKSKEKRVMVVRVAPPCADAPQTVEALGDALRTELLGEPAPLYIACGDVCDVCGVAMRIVGAHSVWGCPTCGKTRKYDLMTSAAVGHGTEHDYSSNTYHQKNRLVETLENTQGTEYADPPEAITRLVAQALLQSGKSAFCAPALQIAIRDEVAVRGPFVDAIDAIERLQGAIPDIEMRLKADSAAQKTRTALRDVAKNASAWLVHAHPELDGVVGKAKTDAVAKFQDRVRKQYERSSKIGATLGGFSPLQMRPDQEEYLRRLFVACASEYDAYRKPGQHNWPAGYPLFIRSVLLLMGLDEFAVQYPIATGPKNRKEHEEMRRAIWAKMDWECVPITQPFPPLVFSNDPDGVQRKKLKLLLAAEGEPDTAMDGWDDDDASLK